MTEPKSGNQVFDFLNCFTGDHSAATDYAWALAKLSPLARPGTGFTWASEHKRAFEVMAYGEALPPVEGMTTSLPEGQKVLGKEAVTPQDPRTPCRRCRIYASSWGSETRYLSHNLAPESRSRFQEVQFATKTKNIHFFGASRHEMNCRQHRHTSGMVCGLIAAKIGRPSVLFLPSPNSRKSGNVDGQSNYLKKQFQNSLTSY